MPGLKIEIELPARKRRSISKLPARHYHREKGRRVDKLKKDLEHDRQADVYQYPGDPKPELEAQLVART